MKLKHIFIFCFGLQIKNLYLNVFKRYSKNFQSPTAFTPFFNHILDFSLKYCSTFSEEPFLLIYGKKWAYITTLLLTLRCFSCHILNNSLTHSVFQTGKMYFWRKFAYILKYTKFGRRLIV